MPRISTGSRRSDRFADPDIPSDIDQVLATLTADVASVQMHADEVGDPRAGETDIVGL